MKPTRTAVCKTNDQRNAMSERETLRKPQWHSARYHIGASVALILVAIFFLSAALLSGEEAKPKTTAQSAKKKEKKPRKQLGGAELYAIHCNRCHPERYASERTADQWKSILLHMRTRASLPAEQAQAILKFLQENSGN